MNYLQNIIRGNSKNYSLPAELAENDKEQNTIHINKDRMAKLAKGQF